MGSLQTRAGSARALGLAALWQASLLACNPASPPATQTTSPSAPARASAAPSAPPKEAPSASAAPPAAGEKSLSCVGYEQAFARGKKLLEGRQWKEAIEAFDQAIRARPYDAVARVERGAARTELGRPSPGDFRVARSLTANADLERRAWFEEGRASEAAKKPEEARLAFAVAAGLGHPEASKRLADRSRCATVAVTTGLSALEIVQGWRGVIGARDTVNCDDDIGKDMPEAEAKKAACTPCLQGEKGRKQACDGKGPWDVNVGYMHCTVFTMHIQPLDKNRFSIERGHGRPALVKQGKTWMQDEGKTSAFEWNSGDFEGGADTMFNGVRWASSTIELDPPPCPIDSQSEVEAAMSSGCQSGPGVALEGPRVRRWYSDKGKPLLELREWAGEPQVAFSGKQAKITGAGCDLTVDLPESPLPGAARRPGRPATRSLIATRRRRSAGRPTSRSPWR